MSIESHFRTTSQRVFNWVRTLKKDPCVYCGKPGGTIDHIFPHSNFDRLAHEFGPNGWQNFTGACAECNVKKGSKGLLLFLLELNNGQIR